MKASILYINDMHKRWQDSESVKGILAVQQKQQLDFLKYIKENNITHVILGGDWYDRGFHGLAMAWGQTEMDRRLSAAVNGNLYMCVGNHFYLERDENPEMYIIQPCDLYKPSLPIPVAEKPICQCINTLKVGTVQIDFFHYSKTNKDYVRPRDPDTTYHIGIYHDDRVVPSYVRELEGFHSPVSQEYYNRIYDNIDFAICAHIHSKVGMTQMTLINGRQIPMFIPGVMHATRNVDNEKHTAVTVPVINILDDNSIEFKAATFSTYLDELQFNTRKKNNTKVDTTVEAIASHTAGSVSRSTLAPSLGAHLQSIGYDTAHLEMANAAMHGELSFNKAVTILSAMQKGAENL